MGMKFLKYEVDIGPNDVIEVTLDKQANVRVMDYSNFQEYQRGRKHRYYGGLIKRSPHRIIPPRQGRWYVAIDLGGYTGTVKASVKVLRS